VKGQKNAGICWHLIAPKKWPKKMLEYAELLRIADFQFFPFRITSLKWKKKAIASIF
jgi:hypothetical protein